MANSQDYDIWTTSSLKKKRRGLGYKKSSHLDKYNETFDYCINKNPCQTVIQTNHHYKPPFQILNLEKVVEI